MTAPVRNLIVVSDLHCGDRFGLCPPRVVLDSGLDVRHTQKQAIVWNCWNEFWDDWVPMVTKGEPYAIAVNGDAIEGVHHGSATPITNNVKDQRDIAYEVLAPQRERVQHFYIILGTEVHGGKSLQDEADLAQRLDATPGDDGSRSTYERSIYIGDGLVHLLHHIGGTSAAPRGEWLRVLHDRVDCGEPIPDLLVRSHVHRYTEWEKRVVVTPPWQLKTPHGFKVAMGRNMGPQVGGIAIRWGSQDGLYHRVRKWGLKRRQPERPLLEVSP